MCVALRFFTMRRQTHSRITNAVSRKGHALTFVRANYLFTEIFCRNFSVTLHFNPSTHSHACLFIIKMSIQIVNEITIVFGIILKFFHNIKNCRPSPFAHKKMLDGFAPVKHYKNLKYRPYIINNCRGNSFQGRPLHWALPQSTRCRCNICVTYLRSILRRNSCKILQLLLPCR